MAHQGAWVPVGATVPAEATVPVEVVPVVIIVLEGVVLAVATEALEVAGRPVHPVAEVDLPEEVDLLVAVATANQFNVKKIATNETSIKGFQIKSGMIFMDVTCDR